LLRRGPATISRAVFEFALIVISVVLGLAVNNWRETSQVRKRMADMRAEFAQEIRANRDELSSEGCAPLHRKLVTAWTLLAAIAAPTPADRDAAWNVASTGMHPFHRVGDPAVHPQPGERHPPDAATTAHSTERASPSPPAWW